MGFYVNHDSKGNELPTFGKADALKADGAVITDGKQFEANLICIADRLTHEAAIYCYDEREFGYIQGANERTGDEVIWLTHPKAKELSKFPR